MGGDVSRQRAPADALEARIAAMRQQPQQVQVNLKILGPDFTVLAMFDTAIHFLGGVTEVLGNLKKQDAQKAFASALEHLTKRKAEFFAVAAAEGEKAAPKVEVATPQEQAAVGAASLVVQP